MVQWKQEIGDDPEKFGLRAKSDSHCPTAANGGKKPRWNKAEREYQEVYTPPVKMEYDAGKVGHRSLWAIHGAA